MAVQDASRAHEFVMSFVALSDAFKEPYIDRWTEVLENFMVEPSRYREPTMSPYQRGTIYRDPRRQIILKDPETHKALMTYASKLVRVLFSERDGGYIKTRARGEEDVLKAQTVGRLLRYDFSLPGTFRSFVESIVDMLLFGTSILEVDWYYCEREMPVRRITSELGVETDEFTRMSVPVHDDVRITPVDIVDFYPDPTRYRIADMAGAAKRFRMNAIQARYEVKRGRFDKEAVERAIGAIGKSTVNPRHDNFRAGIDQPETTDGYGDFKEMIGYEYRGDVPWEDDQGSSRREIAILNNVCVMNEQWSLADEHLPWHTLIINPTVGRFYGKGPGDVMRFDQDFTDALKILLAEAVIRKVHPPVAYDPDGFDGDLSKVKRWTADEPIPVKGGPTSIGVLRYDADINGAFNLMGALQASMQGASGALGAIQGQPGPDREAASVGIQRIQMALDRPELAAMVLERDCLPPIGAAMLRRNQQYLDTDGLKLRIGEKPESVWIGTILGDFDVEFVGSRVAMTRQEKLQAIDRIVALSGAVPPLMAQLPWQALGQWVVGDLLELPEVSSKMGDPREFLLNMLTTQFMGGGGAGQNGVSTGAEPAGMLPAQAGGGPFGPSV